MWKYAHSSSHSPLSAHQLFTAIKLLSGIPSYLLKRLQSAMKTAVQLAFSVSKFDHVTQSASELTSHWLKVPERIKFKLAVLVYKCLHWRASQYLADELRQLADSTAQQHLCSASSTSHCPPYMTFNLIDYAFLTLLWRSTSLQPFIYCFLQSPKDFSLQVQRSTFTQYPHRHIVQK